MAISSKAIMAVLALSGEERRIMAEALQDESITTAQALAERLEKMSGEQAREQLAKLQGPGEDGPTAAAELSKLSPAEKLEVASRIRREAFDELAGDNEPGEGPTVAEVSAIMDDLRALDHDSRELIMRAIPLIDKEGEHRAAEE